MEDIITKLRNKLKQQKAIVDKVEIQEYNYNEIAPQFKSTKWNEFDVHYDDINHVYFIIKNNNRIPLISVTTFIGLFVPEMDVDEMATRCAMKDHYECNCLDTTDWDKKDIKQRVKLIKKAWEDNNKQATSYGTAAHAAHEMLVKYPDATVDFIYSYIKYEYGRHAREIIKTFIPNVKNILQQYNGYRMVAEPVLCYPPYGLAGQSDLVLFNDDKKTIVILDYKTNKVNPKEKQAYGYLEGLLNTIPNSPWYEYCLQLSIYANMLLKQYPEYTIERMALIWLDPQTGEAIPLDIDFTSWMSVVNDTINTLKANGVFKQAYSFFNN